MIQEAFQIQREAIIQSGGFVHPSGHFVRSEDGGVRFASDCDNKEISLIVPKAAWRTVLQGDFDRPSDSLVSSMVDLWRYCFPVIDDLKRFLGNRYIENDTVIPLISWTHNHDLAKPLKRSNEQVTLAGSFMKYSKRWRASH
jgi:hypothetical protein